MLTIITHCKLGKELFIHTHSYEMEYLSYAKTTFPNDTRELQKITAWVN